MAGMNVGPSTGFLARMKQNLPQAINMAGQQFGGPVFGPAARITGALMKKPENKGGGKNQPTSGGLPTPGTPNVPVNGPSGLSANQPGSDINNHSDPGGIVRGPSMLPPMFGPGTNTGITGGYMPGQLGTMAQNAGTGMAPPMSSQNPLTPNGMGMFRMYNQLSNQRGTPYFR